VDSNNTCKIFFDVSYERRINELMFFRHYKLPVDEISDYIERLIEIPLSAFIDYIRENCNVSYLESKDIVQFSSLDDASRKITRKLLETDDEGVSYSDIGRILLDDEVVRKEGAYNKYGENHAKTAQELGLVQIRCNLSYLTCLGYVFSGLSENIQDKLVRRLSLRNKYIMLLVILSKNESVPIDCQMGFLAESTRIRRLPNVKKIWHNINDEDEMTKELLQNVQL